MTWDSTFALGAASFRWFVLGLKTGRLLGSTSANLSPALVESFAGKFQVLGLQRAPSAFFIDGGPFVIIAVGRVSVDSGLDMLEQRSGLRSVCLWDLVFHVLPL